MRLALRSSWLRGALAALLLVAQHGALTHALTHAGGQKHFVESASHVVFSQHDDGAPAKAVAEQCAFDLVYSQVLGGVHPGDAVERADTTPHILRISAVPPLRGVTAVVPYDTRGPPVFS